MYSGTTFRIKSGRVMGVHQKIDRVAKRHITRFIPRALAFPTLHEILHFEGLNGPDGIKRKSPGRDEPWHFVDPYNDQDTKLLTMITEHIHNMAEALATDNRERAAFEAAWMSHAITDALTPAHHYPLEEKLSELRGGEGLHTRNSTMAKVILPGATVRKRLQNNWEFWGTKGVMTTHFAFELGVATAIAPHTLDGDPLHHDDIERLRQEGFGAVYRQALRTVADMKMYEEFSEQGWTRHLAKQTRDTLLPVIIKTVALGWYAAVDEARARS